MTTPATIVRWMGSALLTATLAGCASASPNAPAFDAGTSSAAPSLGPGAGGDDAGSLLGSVGVGAEGGAPAGGDPEQPATCAEAASTRSYVGCEFWPTVVYNPVWSVFDFAAVVANASSSPAQISVDRGGSPVSTATVAPGDVGVVYLPWVTELKGPDFDSCTLGARPTASTLVAHGAYHLTSSVPVTVWQFSPLEYMAGSGGPAGKTWTCPYAPASCNGDGVNCLR